MYSLQLLCCIDLCSVYQAVISLAIVQQQVVVHVQLNVLLVNIVVMAIVNHHPSVMRVIHVLLVPLVLLIVLGTYALHFKTSQLTHSSHHRHTYYHQHT